jgi:purine-binding chemotaxis protein CheW
MAPDRAIASQARPEQEFFCFRAGELRLAVPSENVLEVIRTGPLTPLPRTPSFLLGVTGHRGEVIPVMDMLRLLGKGEARVGPRTRLFIGTSGNYRVGVVADAVLGLKRVPVADILPPPLGGDAAVEHLLGIYEVPGTQETMALLSFPKLLQSARARAVVR